MFFFITFGSDSNIYDHGPILPIHCPRCNNNDYWRMLEKKDSTTVYWIPVSTTSRHFLVCLICRWASGLSAEQVQRAFYIRQYTLAFFDKLISNEEYGARLNEVRYLH